MATLWLHVLTYVILYSDICCLAYYCNTFTISIIYCQMYIIIISFFTLAIKNFKIRIFGYNKCEKNKIQ
jgi:hypothetical protein